MNTAKSIIQEFNILVVLRLPEIKNGDASANILRRAVEVSLVGNLSKRGGSYSRQGQAVASVFVKNLDAGLLMVRAVLEFMEFLTVSEIGVYDKEDGLIRTFHPVSSKPFAKNFEILDDTSSTK
jgi:hypothetical protein